MGNVACTRASPHTEDPNVPAMPPPAEQAQGSTIKTFEEAMLFPPWCFKDAEIDDNVRNTVRDVWNRLLSGETRPFKEAQQQRPKLKPLVFFYNVFYDSFFSLVPEVLPLYTGGLNQQGKMLAHIIHFIVSNLDGGDQFETTLKYLAVLHNQRGVDPSHYTVMGICLLFAIRRCVGDEIFTADAKYCWTVLYSRMVQIFIPIACSQQMEQDAIVMAKMDKYREQVDHMEQQEMASKFASNDGIGQAPSSVSVHSNGPTMTISKRDLTGQSVRSGGGDYAKLDPTAAALAAQLSDLLDESAAEEAPMDKTGVFSGGNKAAITAMQKLQAADPQVPTVNC